MQLSDLIAFLALLGAGWSIYYTWYRDQQNRTAGLKFHLGLDRSYKYTIDENGKVKLGEEQPTRTKLLIRNMSSRPTAIVELRAKNQNGSILVAEEGSAPATPFSIAPWGVSMIETTWPSEHTEGLYFCIKDFDDHEYEVHPPKQIPRSKPGDDPFASPGTRWVNVDGKYWKRMD